MTTPDDVQAAFMAVCSFCEKYASSGESLKSNDPLVTVVKTELEKLSAWLSADLSALTGEEPLLFSHALGAGYYPRVPWIAILPSGQAVNSGIYAGMCFGKEGGGAVAGCLTSAEDPHTIPYQQRPSTSVAEIDVTDANHLFANPLEIPREHFHKDKLVSHLRESVNLARKYIADVNTNPAPDLRRILTRYCEEQVIFLSSGPQPARYIVSECTGTTAQIGRLDANEPESLTFSYAKKLIQRVRAAGSFVFSDLDSTSAVRAAVLQAESLGLSSDRKQILDLTAPADRLVNFRDVLRRMNRQEVYKPVMIQCVLDGLDSGELHQNQIPFDWIAQRFITSMKALGKTVKEQQAVQPFFHLTSELFWMHAVHDVNNPMRDSREGVSAARQRVKYALLKQTYWNLLQDPGNRNSIRSELQQLIHSGSSVTIESVETPPITMLVPEFKKAAAQAGFTPPGDLCHRFIASLATKPFVILTGNSGTGKTKIAELFAQWLLGPGSSGYALVAVGADWTDNRNVLGFVNHLRSVRLDDEESELPVFHSTPILDLLLAAAADPDTPHFLILDEMNLSHVERYFADFLSALESREGKISLHSSGRSLPIASNESAKVSAQIQLPPNLFIIGTVNVDETTYMFSPKVLDRANVIEFRITPSDAKTFLIHGGSIGSIKQDNDGHARSFLRLTHQARSTPQPDLSLFSTNEKQSALAECRRFIGEVFEILHAARLEFGFRTMAEILRYATVDHELAEDQASWNPQRCMDVQILQKVLPKLHGSRKRMAPVLAALAKYSEQCDLSEASKFVTDEVRSEAFRAAPSERHTSPAFAQSYGKLCELVIAVRRDQFVSFIH